LDDHHDTHRSDAEPWTDQDHGEGSTQKMTRSARRNREVEHLKGEDEGSDQAGQSDAALLEIGTRPFDGVSQAARGYDRRSRRSGAIEKSVRYVQDLCLSCDLVATRLAG